MEKLISILQEIKIQKKLGGMTNTNLLVDYKKESYVLRFPSLEFEEIIN